MQGQLRDAAEGGRREDAEADRAQAAVRTATQRAAYRLKKLAHGKKKVWTGRLESRAGTDDADPENSTPDIQTEQTDPPSNAEPVRIKTREAADQSFSVEGNHPDSPRSEPTQIKTKDSCTRPQTIAPAHEPVIENPVQPERKAPNPPERGRQKFVRERVRNISVRQAEDLRQSDRAVSAPEQKLCGDRQTVGTADRGPASKPDGQRPQSLEQGRQRFVQERQKKAAAQRREKRRGPEHITPMRQRDAGTVQPQHTPTLPAQDGKRPIVRGTASNGSRRMKEARSGANAVGRASRQALKGADSSGKVLQTGGRSTQPMRQAARAAVQARQRAVQAAGAARRTAAAVGRPVAKAAVSALRGAVSAIRAALVPLTAGGGAVIAVVLVLCLVGALLMSPLGIFFSGEDSGGQTMSTVVREINQKYDAQLEEIKAGVTYDEVSLSGSRASWIEILAVYAVKTTSDPTNGQEVVTMNEEKKALLKQVFWDMTQLSSFTSTVPGEDDEEDTTTLYITVTTRTAYEMADIYGFNADQRRQLAEMLSDEYRELWNAVLYGIGTGSGEIVAVALSQVGNVGGQPYWSWYGFSSRVDWCAIFVSWCANECGYIDAGVIPKFAGCVQGSRWFKDRGLWQDRSYTPNPGDIIFFDWNDPGGYSGPQDGVPDHVGIVEKVENGRVYTIEGNSGDKCCQRSYPLGYYEIYGYGLPMS